MKGTSKHRRIQEIRWEDLKTRKATHELLLYFKIVNNLCPSYLVDSLPLQVSETEQITPYERPHLLASHTVRFKRYFSPVLLPCGMTLVLTYVVSNPLVLLNKLYLPFTMCL